MKLQFDGLRYWRKRGVFSRSRPANLKDIVVAMWVCGTPQRKHFRTINVQSIGAMRSFSRCGSSYNQ